MQFRRIDCNDDNPDQAPGMEELLNNIDDDCDGDVDEGLLDADGDGFTVEDGDCNDTQMWANPDVLEMCDGFDNDCDGEVDEDCPGITSGQIESGKEGCSVVDPTSFIAMLIALFGIRRREQ